jgi:hypothetical protein
VQKTTDGRQDQNVVVKLQSKDSQNEMQTEEEQTEEEETKQEDNESQHQDQTKVPTTKQDSVKVVPKEKKTKLEVSFAIKEQTLPQRSKECKQKQKQCVGTTAKNLRCLNCISTKFDNDLCHLHSKQKQKNENKSQEQSKVQRTAEDSVKVQSKEIGPKKCKHKQRQCVGMTAKNFRCLNCISTKFEDDSNLCHLHSKHSILTRHSLGLNL